MKKGEKEDEMIGWHHQLNGHEFEQTLGDSEVQGSLACCSSRQRVRHDLANKQQQESIGSIKPRLNITGLSCERNR